MFWRWKSSRIFGRWNSNRQRHCTTYSKKGIVVAQIDKPLVKSLKVWEVFLKHRINSNKKTFMKNVAERKDFSNLNKKKRRKIVNMNWDLYKCSQQIAPCRRLFILTGNVATNSFCIKLKLSYLFFSKEQFLPAYNRNPESPSNF